MSRPREFDVDRALQQSMEVFWERGFKSTSYEDLTRTTQVKKQSLYCVFKDKRELFLKALALYRKRSIAMLEEVASREASPLEKLEAICGSMLHQKDETLRRGCLMVNSALEFGEDDREVNREVNREVTLMSDQVKGILEKIIRDGQKQGFITARESSKELAVYLNNVLVGAKVMEKAGASREQIEAVLRTSFALIISENTR